MTDDRRAPWWYSGDDEQSGASAAEGPPAPEGDHADVPPDESSSSSGLDWSSLVAGAQRMVDWATERVVVPHAEHDDPAGHPDCVVCRTLVVLRRPAPEPLRILPMYRGSSGSRSGRRPRRPRLSAVGMSIGVDIGGTKILAGIVDEAGNVRATARRPTPATTRMTFSTWLRRS